MEKMNKKCNKESGFCEKLTQIISPPNHKDNGFKPLQTLTIEGNVDDYGEQNIIGFYYQYPERKKKFTISFCPFCGENIDPAWGRNNCIAYTGKILK